MLARMGLVACRPGWAKAGWFGGDAGRLHRSGELGRGQKGGEAGWACWRLGLFGFTIFLSPFLIPYLFIPLLHLLPKAPKLVYMCYQHVQLLVGSSRGYLRVSGAHVEGQQFTGIDLQGRSIGFMS